MLDVNCAWLPHIARDRATSLADNGLYWLEEPVWPPELYNLLEIYSRELWLSTKFFIANSE